MSTINRTKAMAFLGITSILVLALSACAPTTQAPQDATKERDKATTEKPTGIEVAKQRGGKLVMAENSAFGNPNDPHLVITATGRAHSMPVVNWLLKRDVYDKNQAIVPDLAKSWEASKDGLTYTFKLREGVRFHNVPPVNGREFTSEDAKYSLMRITADPAVTVEKWKPRFQRRTDFGEIKSIQTPDKYTLVVNLKEPFGPFMDSIAHPGTAMLPREFVEKFPEKIILEGLVGTGPYMPTEYRNQQLAGYKKNPDYWKKDSQGGQLPYLDEVAIPYFGDIQSEMASFRARQLDITGGGIQKSMVEAITRDLPNTRVTDSPSLTIWNFRFNMKHPPFQDARVRRAIHLAVDRYQILELIGEGKGILSGPLTPTFPELSNTMDWLLSQPGYRKDKTQDLEEAKRLLKEAGYGDGLTFGVMISSPSTAMADMAALLADQLKPLKVGIKVEPADYAGQWVPRSASQQFEMSVMGHVMNFDGDSLLSTHLSTPGGRNYGKYSDSTLDNLIEKSKKAVALEERRKWAHEAEKRILEQAPMIFLYNPFNTMLAQSWVHNAAHGPVSGSKGHLVEMVWVEKR